MLVVAGVCGCHREPRGNLTPQLDVGKALYGFSNLFGVLKCQEAQLRPTLKVKCGARIYW